MAKPAKKITMRDIADMAGVSAMTVSTALSGKPGVSSEMRRRIREIADALNYTPNILATSFRNDRSNTIGVILSSTFDTVFTLLFKGIETVAKQEGLGILVATTEDDLDLEMEAIKMLAAKRVDGIILTSALSFNPKQKKLLDKLGVPYVLTVRSYHDQSVTTVLNNNHAGAYSMVDYLANTGSRKFLFLAMEKRRCSSLDRMRGWEDAMTAHGLSMSPKYIDYVAPVIESGYKAMRDRIRKGGNWDTVVCGNDTIAIGAMKALFEAGIDIPTQVRVGGYDGLPLTEHLRVPLTTIQQPLYEIGQTAMYLLKNKIEDPGVPGQQISINSKLVIRCST